MTTPKTRTSTKAFEDAAKAAIHERYVLRLYVAGATPGSVRTVASLRTICDEHLEGRYELEVIDVYQQPSLARDEQIVAVPTLVKKLPLPMRRILGDLSDRQRVLLGLDLKPKTHDKKRSAPKNA